MGVEARARVKGGFCGTPGTPPRSTTEIGPCSVPPNVTTIIMLILGGHTSQDRPTTCQVMQGLHTELEVVCEMSQVTD